MKKYFTITAAILGFTILSAQDIYKQDFLLMLNKVPAVATAEASYHFMACKDKSCNEFVNSKTLQIKASKELAGLQTVNASVAVSGGAGMSQAEMQGIADKLEKMSDDEKQQWAMQNAQAFMPSGGTARMNMDMNNSVVTDAAEYIAEQQAQEMDEINRNAEMGKMMETISQKYQLQKDALVKKFQTESKTQHNPMSGSPYIFGEAGEQQIARYNTALAAFKKDIVPVLDNELNEKLKYLAAQRQSFTARYRMTEDKIMVTHYGADAKEPSNKGFIITAHTKLLHNVMSFFQHYEAALLNTANEYAGVAGIEKVKAFVIPE